MRRTCSLILITVFCVFALLSPLSATSLEDKRREAADIKNQISQVDNQLSGIVQEYESTYAQLSEINLAIQSNLAKLDATNKELLRCKDLLSARVNSIYRSDNVGFISVVLGAQDFEDFLSRLGYLMKICEEDAITLENIEKLKREIEKCDAELAENKATKRIVLNKISAQKADLDRALKQKQELFSSVNNEIKALEEEESRRVEEERRRALASASKGTSSDQGSTASSSFAPDPSFIFPVAQPYSYCDSWHAPRVGHLHQGCDIFALRGTSAVACVTGTVLRLSNGNLGGNGITLQDKSGNTYYYGHLDGYVSGIHEGMKVLAGQTIGYVGDTGNAKGTPPHVHFEIHPGGGSAINPTPILKLVG